MKTNRQVEISMSELKRGKTLKHAAAKADMCEKTARRYRDAAAKRRRSCVLRAGIARGRIRRACQKFRVRILYDISRRRSISDRLANLKGEEKMMNNRLNEAMEQITNEILTGTGLATRRGSGSANSTELSAWGGADSRELLRRAQAQYQAADRERYTGRGGELRSRLHRESAQPLEVSALAASAQKKLTEKGRARTKVRASEGYVSRVVVR